MNRTDLLSLLDYRINLLDEIERCENIKHNNYDDINTDMRLYLYSLRKELRNINAELARLSYFPYE